MLNRKVYVKGNSGVLSADATNSAPVIVGSKRKPGSMSIGKGKVIGA